jgi:sec-independent protein translocase protein TatB
MVPGLSLEHIIILGVIALVVVGPKDLPLLLRKMGQWTARLRAMAQEFRSGFDELARQAELDELKREVDALRRTTNLNSIAKGVSGDLSRPLGTLESYAGVTSPPAPKASSSMEEAPPPQSPPEPYAATAEEAPPQSSRRDDGASVEDEQSPRAARTAP